MKNNNTAYRLLRFIFSPVFRLIFRPKIAGKENIPTTGGAILAGNHKHALDPILVDISTKRTVRTLAKKDLHDGKFGFIFRAAGTIPVDLHNKKNHAALEAAVRALEDGQIVNVSPEAKRNYTDQLLLPFKYGAVSMASRTDTPVIPYSITGQYKLFSNDLKIVFGKPYYIRDPLNEANEQLYNRIASLLRENMSTQESNNKLFTSFKEWEAINEQKKSS